MLCKLYVNEVETELKTKFLNSDGVVRKASGCL